MVQEEDLSALTACTGTAGHDRSGVAALEDKIVRKSIVDVILTPMYEGGWFQLRVATGAGSA